MKKKKSYYKLIFIIYKNEWNNLLSKKQRCDTRQSKKYYESNKKVLTDKARDKYRDLSDEEKK